MTTRRAALALLLALAAGPLAGCSSDDDDGSGSGSTIIEQGGRSGEGGDTDGEQPPGATPTAPANPTPSS